MEFSKKGTTDPMNGHFSPINRLESVNGIQFSLCRTPTNLIFAHRDSVSKNTSNFCLFSWSSNENLKEISRKSFQNMMKVRVEFEEAVGSVKNLCENEEKFPSVWNHFRQNFCANLKFYFCRGSTHVRCDWWVTNFCGRDICDVMRKTEWNFPSMTHATFRHSLSVNWFVRGKILHQIFPCRIKNRNFFSIENLVTKFYDGGRENSVTKIMQWCTQDFFSSWRKGVVMVPKLHAQTNVSVIKIRIHFQIKHKKREGLPLHKFLPPSTQRMRIENSNLEFFLTTTAQLQRVQS